MPQVMAGPAAAVGQAVAMNPNHTAATAMAPPDQDRPPGPSQAEHQAQGHHGTEATGGEVKGGAGDQPPAACRWP